MVLTHGIKEEEIKGINYMLERKVGGIIVFPVGNQADYFVDYQIIEGNSL